MQMFVSNRKRASIQSHSFAVLRRRVLSALRQKVIWQIGENLECACQALAPLTQHDFVAAAEDFQLLALDLELLWHSDGLTVARTKNPRCCHFPHLACIYSCVYTFERVNARPRHANKANLAVPPAAQFLLLS